MAKRTCSIDGCERPMSTRGWCGTHYQRWRAHGTVELLPAPLRTCTVKGCDRSFYGRDLCKLHYDRHRLHGSTDVPSRPAAPPQPLCRVEGCDSVSVVRSREMCDKHYTRWKRRGNPLVVRHHFDFVACAVNGCGKAAKVRGWCNLHYKRWKAHGDPEATKKRTRHVCSAEACERLARSRGWCPMHLQRWKKYGDPTYEWVPRTGESHHGWKGNAVSYRSVHSRLRAQRGVPDRCEHCGRGNSGGYCQWALIWDRAAVLVESEAGLLYSTCLDDYMPLCVRCHNRYDKRRPRVDRRVEVTT